MNNKGFAITTMLYGTFILFLMLMLVMVGLLNSFKTNMDILIDDGANSSRKIVEKKCSSYIQDSNDDKIYSYEERVVADMEKSVFDNILNNLCS